MKLTTKMYANNGKLVDFTKCDKITKRDAIYMKCIECCGFDRAEVRKCDAKTCALFVFKEARLKLKSVDKILSEYNK